MNNPNFPNQSYAETQRGVGRDRSGRPSWREDEQNRFRNRSSWDEQNEYAQPRYSPHFEGFNESAAQDRQLGQSRDYDGYSYGSGQGQRAGRDWPTDDFENYGTQQDYANESPGNAQSRPSPGRNYVDSGNFGFRSGYGQQRNLDYGRSSQARQWSGQAGQSTGAYGLQKQNHRGKGPKGYVRTDERIREEICECLSDDPRIDASEVSVEVRDGVVMLEGSVQDRAQKHRIEDIADSCSGVKDVHNSLRVTPSVGSGLSTSNSQLNMAETSASSQRNTDAASKATKQ